MGDAEQLINRIIMEDEGGWEYTNRPDDAGGPTYGGMTWVTFNGWQRKHVGSKHEQWTSAGFRASAEADSALLQEAILRCYRDVFYVPGHVAEVPDFAQFAYLSELVNTGDFKETLKKLQMAVNKTFSLWSFTTAQPLVPLLVDGHWGPKTKEALRSGYVKDSRKTFKLSFSDACVERRIRIVQRNSREWARVARQNFGRSSDHAPLPRVLQSENLMGWWNRCIRYRSA